MNENRGVIWSNCDLDYDDWRADLKERYPELSDEERSKLMYELNGYYRKRRKTPAFRRGVLRRMKRLTNPYLCGNI